MKSNQSQEQAPKPLNQDGTQTGIVAWAAVGDGMMRPYFRRTDAEHVASWTAGCTVRPLAFADVGVHAQLHQALKLLGQYQGMIQKLNHDRARQDDALRELSKRADSHAETLANLEAAVSGTSQSVIPDDQLAQLRATIGRCINTVNREADKCGPEDIGHADFLDADRENLKEVDRIISSLRWAGRQQMEMELQQSEDMRADLEVMLDLVAKHLGVDPEPHQTWRDRLLEAADAAGQGGERAQGDDPAGLPPLDQGKPRNEQGLYGKFLVRRVDGSDLPGEKHHGCRYFVLDVDHDKYAAAALGTYASHCEQEYPRLAKDLREKFGAHGGRECISTNDDVERVARLAGWDNRKYMTPADYSTWCDRIREFVRLATTPQPDGDGWIAEIDIEVTNYTGWCWIVHKGRVVSSYRDKKGIYRFHEASPNCFMSECITFVMPWERPQPPAEQEGAHDE